MNSFPKLLSLTMFIVLAASCKQKPPSPTVATSQEKVKPETEAAEQQMELTDTNNSEENLLPPNQEERERIKQEALERIQNLSGTETLVLAARSTPQGLAPTRPAKKKTSPDAQLNRCQSGHIESCHAYGWHEQKKGNLRNARSFYEVSCRKGILKSCNNLGWLSEQRGQISIALDYYSQACLKKHPGSCSNLKRALEKARSFR